MRVINRTAITIVGADPYLEWTRTRDAAFGTSKEVQISVPRTRPFGTAYLLPDAVDEVDLFEWVEDNYATLFESQLSVWTEDESAWPEGRDLKMFRQWFRIDIHSVVVDVGDDDIDGEEV
jgi:hypothetical protein